MEYNKYKRLCFLDIESTGVYWNSDAPIQVAAMIYDNQGNLIDSFNERIKTTHKIAPDASAVHGIYAKDLVNCRSEFEVLSSFCCWMAQQGAEAIVTYNGEVFDRPMLNHRCEVMCIPYTVFNKNFFPGIDCRETVMEAKRRDLYDLKSLGRKWKLTLVAEKLGFSSDGAHDALADVVMLKNVWFMLDPQIHPTDWGKPTVTLF